MRSTALKGLEAEHDSLAASMSLDGSSVCASALPPRNRLDVAAEPVRDTDSIKLAGAVQPDAKPSPKSPLTMPKELPGSDELGFSRPKDKAENEQYFKKLYPSLGRLSDEQALAPGPEGRPMTLADLQKLASQYSPSIRAAEAGVSAVRGGVRQSMAYPNPTFSFENDTFGTGPAGYPGFSIEQLIKTGNKLELQGAASTMDLFNAQLALRRSRLDVAYQVRNGYFAVLVAQENVKLSRAFARFTDQIYERRSKWPRRMRLGRRPMSRCN